VDKATLCGAGTNEAESPLSERPTWQLSRTPTGFSVADHTNSTVHFKPADSGRYRLVVLYQGSEDDLFAVRFGLQLAKNEAVDLKILNARAIESGGDEVGKTGQETGFSKTTSDYEFETLRVSIPGSIAGRVSIADSSVPGIEAVSEAISEQSAAETI